MDANVQGLMQGHLGQWLADQESMRAEAKKKAFNRWFYSGIIALPILTFAWFSGSSLGSFGILLTFVIIGGIAAWGYMPISEAKRAIKIGINSAIAREFGISYEHDVNPGSEFEAAMTYGLLPGYDRDTFEDRWYGSLEGHDFNLYEAHLEERRGSGKNRRWVTVFRGALVHMEFGRDFHSTTLLQRKGKHRKWLGLGGRKDHATFDGHRLDYVDQVHPDFEDVFEVWSDDQVEARVLIHPSYVEHLLALERAFNGDAVRALFSRGEVILVVESGNLFESGSMDARDDENRVAEATDQFGAMARLALAINQNERGRSQL
ncbi:DUF3137 domain-containing protein [Erythrobacter sp. Alg231-14]|uniref:DUF3137 domain-containing protein n=1 Tax=Erythrobacter sp. Alg231-14 TaxID=1922225 RepID=UPI000D559DE5